MKFLFQPVRQFLMDAADGGGGGNGGDGGDGGGDAGGGDGNNTVLGAGSGQQQQQQDWRDELPEDLRSAESLKSIQSVPDLAKSFVHAQTLIGKKGVAVPGDDAKPEDWDSFYNQLGRPEVPERYPDLKLELPEGFEIKDEEMAETQKMLWEAGVTEDQFTKIVKPFIEQSARKLASAQQEQAAQIVERLKEYQHEKGSEYAVAVDAANTVLERFGGEEVINLFSENPQLGNNPLIIEFLAKVGNQFQEDSGGFFDKGGGDHTSGHVAAARAELEQLNQDEEFQAALYDAGHRNHDHAVQRRLALIQIISKANEKASAKKN